MPLRILVTCPPMIGEKEQFLPLLKSKDIECVIPDFTQVMSVEDLIKTVPEFDGWIIGDDPATREVFEAGKKGRLKAAVKWGIGIDNVDFDACKDLEIPITNTPNMFGGEVADVGVGYVIGLARETFMIDRSVRNGQWPKPCGVSLAGKTIGLIGHGDIGKNTAKRLIAFDMNINAYDPAFTSNDDYEAVRFKSWPEDVASCDFLIFTCALVKNNHHMLNANVLNSCKDGVRIVNVARGPLIDEEALVKALQSGKVYSAALDVFEVEPLPEKSPLRDMPKCIFGSHNGSNSIDAVHRTNIIAISHLLDFLGVQQ
jgi:D-3-phosphoglycerate dehydrogenase / 2-oxoglutarate reductase